MKQAAASPTTGTSGGKAPFTAGAVGLTLLDTTWRMATPVLLLTAFGIWTDLHFGTKPWVTLALVPVGFTFAALLVKKQLAAVQKAEEEKK